MTRRLTASGAVDERYGDYELTPPKHKHTNGLVKMFTETQIPGLVLYKTECVTCGAEYQASSWTDSLTGYQVGCGGWGKGKRKPRYGGLND